MDRPLVLWSLADDIDKIFIPDPQTSEDRFPPSIVINTVVTRDSSAEVDIDQETNDWRDSISISSDCASYCEECIAVLEPFGSMWDARLGNISTVSHRVDLESSYIHSIQLVPYCTGSKAFDLERLEIENMLEMNPSEPAQTEWASSVQFALKKDGTLRLCIDYRKGNAVTVRDSYSIDKWMSA